jgi:hypothetical protein
MVMKRLSTIVALTLVGATFTAAPAGATHSSGTGPAKDFVRGTGDVTFLGLGLSSTQAHFTADDTVTIAGTFGSFYADVSGLGLGVRFSGVITCLHVAGNEARLGGVVTRSDNEIVPPGTETAGRMVDNGDSSRNDPPDLFVGQVGVPAATCPVFAQPAETVEQGGFVVHDA